MDSFAKDTAAKSGKSERSIERDVTRAKALGSDLDRVAGTSLEKERLTGRAGVLQTTVALVPDLTFRDDIKLNPRLRLHPSCGALTSLHRTLPRPGSPWRGRRAKILGAAASFIYRNGMSFIWRLSPTMTGSISLRCDDRSRTYARNTLTIFSSHRD